MGKAGGREYKVNVLHAIPYQSRCLVALFGYYSPLWLGFHRAQGFPGRLAREVYLHMNWEGEVGGAGRLSDKRLSLATRLIVNLVR